MGREAEIYGEHKIGQPFYIKYRQINDVLHKKS